jgi:CRISPR system Cascade subunit CasC
VLAEKGTEQPRSLSVAFLKPVSGKNMLHEAIDVLRTTRENLDKVYGPCAASYKILDGVKGEGSLKEIQDFVAS